MKKLFWTLGILFIFVSCATAPVPRQIQNVWIVPASFDAVWGITLETLAEMEINIIMPIDKESGLITTELKGFANNQKIYWDCGKLAWTQFSEGHRGKLTVFIRPTGEDQSELKVVAKFEILFMDTTHEALTKSRLERAIQGDTIFIRPCVSTGRLEAEIYKYIQEKIK